MPRICIYLWFRQLYGVEAKKLKFIEWENASIDLLADSVCAWGQEDDNKNQQYLHSTSHLEMIEYKRVQYTDKSVDENQRSVDSFFIRIDKENTRFILQKLSLFTMKCFL